MEREGAPPGCKAVPNVEGKRGQGFRITISWPGGIGVLHTGTPDSIRIVGEDRSEVYTTDDGYSLNILIPYPVKKRIIP
jgi:hypothetical protein